MTPSKGANPQASDKPVSSVSMSSEEFENTICNQGTVEST